MKKIASLLMASILVVGLFAGCDEKPGSSSTASPDPVISLPSESTPVSIEPALPSSSLPNLDDGEYEEGGDWGYLGDIMHTYWFNFTIDEAYTCASLNGYTPAEGKQLLVVHLALKNTTRSTLTMYDTDFQAQWNDDDKQAYAWPVSTLGEEYLWNNQPHIDAPITDDQLAEEYDVAVNSTADGLLIYEVPLELPDGSANRDFSISFQEVFANDELGDVYFLYFTADEK